MKTVIERNEKLLEEFKNTTAAIENIFNYLTGTNNSLANMQMFFNKHLNIIEKEVQLIKIEPNITNKLANFRKIDNKDQLMLKLDPRIKLVKIKGITLFLKNHPVKIEWDLSNFFKDTKRNYNKLYDMQGGLLEMLFNPKFEKKSTGVDFLHDFLKQLSFKKSQRGRPNVGNTLASFSKTREKDTRSCCSR